MLRRVQVPPAGIPDSEFTVCGGPLALPSPHNCPVCVGPLVLPSPHSLTVARGHSPKPKLLGRGQFSA
eukprot:278849-Alexandrium_andersonii.AAC.1